MTINQIKNLQLESGVVTEATSVLIIPAFNNDNGIKIADIEINGEITNLYTKSYEDKVDSSTYTDKIALIDADIETLTDAVKPATISTDINLSGYVDSAINITKLSSVLKGNYEDNTLPLKGTVAIEIDPADVATALQTVIVALGGTASIKTAE